MEKKSFLAKMQDIWSMPDLRARILLTLMILALFRLGTLVMLPGIDPNTLQQLVSAGDSGGGLLGLLDAFTGGAFFSATVFALGIMPYISASIIVQLLGFAVPYFQKLQKDGENGQRKMNQITRLITIGITVVQASAYLQFMSSSYGAAIMNSIPPGIFWFSNILIITSGTIFCMWLGEKITDKGIGNGISILITVGIVVSLPKGLLSELELKSVSNGGLILFVAEMAILVLVIMASVMLTQAVRKIPIQIAKHMVGRGELSADDSMKSPDIPIKLNAAGVMPIIFAQALMFIPGAVAGYFGSEVLASLSDMTSLAYNVVFFILVVVFTFVYTALIVNPQQYAESLKRQNAFIPRVKQGKDTADYIDAVTSRITFPSSLALGFIAILPGIASALFVSSQQFAFFYGGTSLLILVAVVLDTNQQLQTHLTTYEDQAVITGRSKRTASSSKEISI